jgi:CpeT protein
MHQTIQAFPILIFLLLIVASPAASQAAAPPPAALDRLASWMAGSFSSEEQAKTDTNFFDIRLHMTRIWTDRSDGCWLYVEQAAASHLDKPYRQRVYHLTISNDTLVSDVYTLADPLRFAGDWAKPAPLAGLTVDSLSLRDGCSIYLIAEADTAFVGSTRGTGCASDLRGATHATSEVRITREIISSWDRGFDAAGKQVWGAISGGYVFRKIEKR